MWWDSSLPVQKTVRFRGRTSPYPNSHGNLGQGWRSWLAQRILIRERGWTWLGNILLLGKILSGQQRLCPGANQTDRLRLTRIKLVNLIDFRLLKVPNLSIKLKYNLFADEVIHIMFFKFFELEATVKNVVSYYPRLSLSLSENKSSMKNYLSNVQKFLIFSFSILFYKNNIVIY